MRPFYILNSPSAIRSLPLSTQEDTTLLFSSSSPTMDLKAQMLPHSVRNVHTFPLRAGPILFSVGILEKTSGLPWLYV